MDNVFDFRNRLINEYSSFSRSFSKVSAQDILSKVEQEYDRGRYWPEPLIQINPNYKRQSTVQQLAHEGMLHASCSHIFQTGKTEGKAADLHLYVHQLQALAKAQKQQSYVVTTGTGSGKSLAFFVPIIDRILKAKQAMARADVSLLLIDAVEGVTHQDAVIAGYAQEAGAAVILAINKWIWWKKTPLRPSSWKKRSGTIWAFCSTPP